MTKTLEAVFDGEALRPQSPVDLVPNALYSIIITERLPKIDPELDAWQVLESLTGTVDAPPDWSSEHDFYVNAAPVKQKQGQSL